MKLIEKIKDIIFKIKDYNKSADYFNNKFKDYDESADYFNNKFKLKLLHNEPIYRVDILRAVKYNYNGLRDLGICTSISRMCRIYLNKNSSLRDINYKETKNLFPKLSRSNANDFHLESDLGFWWKFNDWKGGRMQFLDWLIEEYKDDKENLRYIII